MKVNVYTVYTYIVINQPFLPFRNIRPMPSQESARNTAILSLRALHTSDDASKNRNTGNHLLQENEPRGGFKREIVCFHMFINIFNTRNQAVKAKGSGGNI